MRRTGLIPPPLPPPPPPPPQPIQSRDRSAEEESGADQGAEGGELPSGWEEVIDTRTGRSHYIDHNRNRTTSIRPSPAINSTLSQDFTSGISHVIEFNLRNFSGSVRQNRRHIQLPGTSFTYDLSPPRILNSPRLSSSSSSSSPDLESPASPIAQSMEIPLPDKAHSSPPTVGTAGGIELLRTSKQPVEMGKQLETTQEQNFVSESTTLAKMQQDVSETSAKHVLDVDEQQHNTKRLKSASSPDTNPTTETPDTVNSLSKSPHFYQAIPEKLLEDVKAEAEYCVTLHVVFCGPRYDSQIYKDFPMPMYKPTGHLLGNRPVYDVKEYLKDNPALGFIIYKEFYCTPGCRGEEFYLRKLKTGGSQLIMHDQRKSSPDRENVVIVSPLLRQAIEDVATYSAGKQGTMELEGYLVFSKPYQFFFHHLSRLKDIKSPDPIIKEQISTLFQYLSSVVGDLFSGAGDLFDQGLVSAESLPFLFRPNELILSRVDNVYVAGILRSGYGLGPPARVAPPPPGVKLPSVDLECWTWGPPQAFSLNRISKIFKVERTLIDEKVKITDLTTFPSRYASGRDIALIKNRGQAFWRLRSMKLISYSGWDFKSEQNHFATRLVVDYSTYRKLHPLTTIFDTTVFNAPVGIKDVDHRPLKLNLKDDPSDEDFMLMPPNVYGFDLKEKKWFNLSVDNVRDVEWNVEAFKLLVLPKSTKDLIQALVEIRGSKGGEKTQMMKRHDIMSDKGQGLIMLLHGGPGTGKTLTAESVAEIARMPLYRVTCGDIGTNAEAVEKYLQNILYLGKAWNCVLLLDEADIFLEQRSLSDLERNSLVSVFLRILEYYEGILILTTNRVGTFDEAFRSRIQISLHYEKLSPEFQRRIWQNFFNMLRTDEEDADLEELEDHLPELAEKEMNGREIRNSLTTARQLALHKKETLCWRHLDLAIKTAGNFNRYLKDVHGGEAEDIARENRDR